MPKFKVGDRIQYAPHLAHSMKDYQDMVVTSIEWEEDGERQFFHFSALVKGVRRGDMLASSDEVEMRGGVNRRERRADSELNQAILKHLQSGKTLSPMEAMVVFGCLRLAAAIHDLRSAGHDIATDMHKDARGKTYARYSLNKVPVAA